MNATVGYNYIRGEFLAEPVPRFEAALEEAYAAGLLGKNILGSGIDFDLYTFVGAGAYICGEETALLDSLEGKTGKPRFKPPFPAAFGLYGMPTTINNTQSYRLGADHPAQRRAVVCGPGPAEFGRHGHILGLRPRAASPAISRCRWAYRSRICWSWPAGCWKGRRLKAVIPGGSSVPVVPGETMIKTNMDYDSLKAAGSSIGSAAVIVMDETTCMVRTLERLSRFYMSESCGQCTPCREGTGWLNRTLKRILAGRGHARGPGPAARCRQPHRGPYHLRAGRCGGLAGAEFPQALPPRVRVHGRSRRPQHRQMPTRRWRHERDSSISRSTAWP